MAGEPGVDQPATVRGVRPDPAGACTQEGSGPVRGPGRIPPSPGPRQATGPCSRSTGRPPATSRPLGPPQAVPGARSRTPSGARSGAVMSQSRTKSASRPARPGANRTITQSGKHSQADNEHFVRDPDTTSPQPGAQEDAHTHQGPSSTTALPPGAPQQTRHHRPEPEPTPHSRPQHVTPSHPAPAQKQVVRRQAI